MSKKRIDDGKRKYRVSVRVIDMLLGASISLICFTLFTFVENLYIRFGIIAWIVVISIVSFTLYCLYVDRKNSMIDDTKITKVKLINEENKTIDEWSLVGQVSVVIGKSTKEEQVYIDLEKSIYSPSIENNHAVLNYAEGNWYIEDLSIDNEVMIQKVQDKEKYNIVKGSPCTLTKGDIIYISKVKLLLD